MLRSASTSTKTCRCSWKASTSPTRNWSRKTPRHGRFSSKPSVVVSSWEFAANSDAPGRKELTGAGGVQPPALLLSAAQNPPMGQLLTKLFQRFSSRARQRRASLFRAAFGLCGNTRILDLGSEWGGKIHAVLGGTPVKPENTFIAGIDPRSEEHT